MDAKTRLDAFEATVTGFHEDADGMRVHVALTLPSLALMSAAQGIAEAIARAEGLKGAAAKAFVADFVMKLRRDFQSKLEPGPEIGTEGGAS